MRARSLARGSQRGRQMTRSAAIWPPKTTSGVQARHSPAAAYRGTLVGVSATSATLTVPSPASAVKGKLTRAMGIELAESRGPAPFLPLIGVTVGWLARLLQREVFTTFSHHVVAD